MLTKALNLRFYRLSSKCLSNNRCFSSQIIKTNENLVKTEDQNQGLERQEKSKSLTQIERHELSQVVRSPVQMDAHWETTMTEKPIKESKFRGPDGGVSVEFMSFLTNKYDFSLQGFKRRIKYYIRLREEYNQRYIVKRHTILGPELATAHFVVYRGGKVRFKHAPKDWITDCEQMPNIYDSRYRLISVDASDVKLRYEALDNFCLLDSLEELNLSKNKLLDDFMCDKIARLFRNSKSLSVLDLSDNPLITNRGIETLHRIKSLKKLIINGTKAAKYPFIELLVILFQDINPKCEVIIENKFK